MSEELKPCPFCGGEASISAPDTYITMHPYMSASDWYINCRLCRYSISRETLDGASAIWNQRTGFIEDDHGKAKDGGDVTDLPMWRKNE